MKTKITTIALLTFLFLTNVVTLNATNFTFSEEEYINDIPFDTKEVVADMKAENALLNFDFSEETYINDIPFNTEVVAAKEASATVIEFDDELYIDDIPFDTEKIAETYYNNVISKEFSFKEEAYIDDIPFNTRAIAFDCLATVSY